MAQPAYIATVKIVGMHHKVPAALSARGCLQHPAIKKTHQRPSAGKAQYRLHLAHPAMLQIELVALDDGLDSAAISMLDEVVVNIGEYRGVNVWLPSQKPVGGKR